eukprot:CAMPEP_0176345840 /NCGR_PEP_ID=MMETSP0126-20121128/5781_1 /TAXON_ID=141414 ORGANISM="Strombidinopsis acuminatum, Strain SPMC142" /NCGR_SAMPLE_ID=MMETSP0126 /ASSEMBLY_ACC=CAM_ASM_000229 /LENGTH=138 /DNA_ID=CAMNT_0017693061 /DNA_START=737 /DNA_END=1153 /DNA_ORIENTATION=-
MPLIRPGQRASAQEFAENLSMEGLRTLVISQKYLTEEEYEQFDTMYKEAKSSMQNREKKIQKAIAYLERDLEFLAVSGVEDKLQDDVLSTIETLRAAGIKVWMLTGDKVETAKCIAISTGLKSIKEDVYEMKEMKDKK